MLTSQGLHAGLGTDISSGHSYSCCWPVVGHEPDGDDLPSFHMCMNWGWEAKLTLKGHSDDHWWTGIPVPALWFTLSSFPQAILLPLLLPCPALPCPRPCQNTKQSPYGFFRLDHENHKVLILFSDQDSWLQPPVDSICLSFLRSHYTNWCKSAFSPKPLLELLYKASWSPSCFVYGWGQPNLLRASRVAKVPSIALVQGRPSCSPSKFRVALVTELRMVLLGVPQAFNSFLSSVHVLYPLCFVLEFLNAVADCLLKGQVTNLNVNLSPSPPCYAS